MQRTDVEPIGMAGRGDGSIVAHGPAPEALRFAEEAMHIGLWRWHPSGAMHWSDGLYAILGLDRTRSAASLTRLRAAMHPEDHERHVALDASLARGPAVEIRFRIIAPGGHLRILALHGETRFDDAGDPVGAFGYVQDVTARRDAIRALRCQAEFARMLRGLVDDVDGLQQPSSGALTGAQVRAGRAILNWPVRGLAAAAGVSVSTIRRMEEFDGPVRSVGPQPAQVRAALEEAGVELVWSQGVQPGVRPRHAVTASREPGLALAGTMRRTRQGSGDVVFE